MKYVNLDKFENWLSENLKRSNYDLNAHLEELERQMFASGSNDYELSEHYTKSGHSECYYFDREDVFDEDGDLVETIITF